MDEWEERAGAAQERRDRLRSFGPQARGLLVETRHGPFVVDPEDSSVGAALLRDGSYADDELALAASFVTPDSDVLVVGAHIGGLAVPIARLCRHLDAVEASPATLPLLAANLLLNRCDNVAVHGVAASDSRMPVEFLLNRDNSGGSKRRPVNDRIWYSYDQPEIVGVEAWPLDERLGDRAYDYILMDIEGSEHAALKGMPKLLGRAQALTVEFLPHHLIDVAGIGIDDFLGVLTPHFGWLFIPGREVLLRGEDAIAAELRAMFARGEGHDGLCFLKEPSPDWCAARGLRRDA